MQRKITIEPKGHNMNCWWCLEKGITIKAEYLTKRIGSLCGICYTISLKVPNYIPDNQVITYLKRKNKL